jgi:hypothetical protein
MTKRNQSAFRIQKFLGGLRYPAAKLQIVERARARGADEELLRALHVLPEVVYPSPVALSRDVGRLASGQ